MIIPENQHNYLILHNTNDDAIKYTLKSLQS